MPKSELQVMKEDRDRYRLLLARLHEGNPLSVRISEKDNLEVVLTGAVDRALRQAIIADAEIMIGNLTLKLGQNHEG